MASVEVNVEAEILPRGVPAISAAASVERLGQILSAADTYVLPNIRGLWTCSPRLAFPDPRLHAIACAAKSNSPLLAAPNLPLIATEDLQRRTIWIQCHLQTARCTFVSAVARIELAVNSHDRHNWRSLRGIFSRIFVTTGQKGIHRCAFSQIAGAC